MTSLCILPLESAVFHFLAVCLFLDIILNIIRIVWDHAHASVTNAFLVMFSAFRL